MIVIVIRASQLCNPALIKVDIMVRGLTAVLVVRMKFLVPKETTLLSSESSPGGHLTWNLSIIGLMLSHLNYDTTKS